MFDGDETKPGAYANNVPDEHKVKRINLLKALMATVVAQNAESFSRTQLIISMAIAIEKTIEVLEAELGTPARAEINGIASQMALLAATSPVPG